MGVLGKPGQGYVDVIYSISAFTNLLTHKAFLMMPSPGLPKVMNSYPALKILCVLWIPDAISSGLHMGSFQNERIQLYKYLIN